MIRPDKQGKKKTSAIDTSNRIFFKGGRLQGVRVQAHVRTKKALTTSASNEEKVCAFSRTVLLDDAVILPLFCGN